MPVSSRTVGGVLWKRLYYVVLAPPAATARRRPSAGSTGDGAAHQRYSARPRLAATSAVPCHAGSPGFVGDGCER